MLAEPALLHSVVNQWPRDLQFTFVISAVSLEYDEVNLCLCSAPRGRVSPVEEGSIQGIVDSSGS